jgi:hypothetical protein
MLHLLNQRHNCPDNIYPFNRHFSQATLAQYQCLYQMHLYIYGALATHEKTKTDVFTNFTFRIIKLVSQLFIHSKGSHFC